VEVMWGSCGGHVTAAHLLAPGRLEALELLHLAAVEGVKRVDEPLFVRLPQGLQHGVHQLEETQEVKRSQGPATRRWCVQAPLSENENWVNCTVIVLSLVKGSFGEMEFSQQHKFILEIN